MPLLLLGAGQPDAPIPDAHTLSDAAIELEDVELYLIAPDKITAHNVTRQVRSIKLLKGPLGQDILTVTADLSSDVCNTAYGTTTAIRDDWEDWALVLYVRGQWRFDGPVVGTATNWEGSSRPGQEFEHPGSHVVLVAECWLTHELRRRYVATVNGGQYTRTDTPNRIFCDVVRKSLVYGETVTPESPIEWQQGTETMDDLGGTSLACAMPAAAGTEINFVADFGHNVLDVLLELCNYPSADADKLWPSYYRVATVVTVGILRGRSGASRQIGTDHTYGSATPIEVSADKGNLLRYSRESDRTKKENHIALNGSGRHVRQRRVYVADAADIAEHGVFAGYEVVEHAHTNEELELEGARLLHERKTGLRLDTFEVAETPDMRCFSDVDIADTLTIVIPVGTYDGSGTADPQTLETNILGLEWILEGHGPARPVFMLGQWPRTPERDLGRAGGGLTCGRGGGGRPRKKSGEPEVDPDDHTGYAFVLGDDGDAAAESLADYLEFTGYDTADVLRAKAYVTNSTGSDAPGSPDVVEYELLADVTSDTEPGTPSIRISIKLTSGAYIRLYGFPSVTP